MAEDKKTQKYEAITPIRKDGKDYAPGKVIDLTEDEAAELGAEVRKK